MILVFIFLTSVASIEVNAGVMSYKTYKDYKVYELSGDGIILRDFVENFLDNYDEVIVQHTPNKTQILLSPELVQTILEEADRKNIKWELKIEDFSQNILSTYSKEKTNEELTWHDYYDIDVINNYLTNVSKTYPEYAKVLNAGRSYEGRSILGVNINSMSEDSGKPAIFIESGIHAREWIAPAAITYFINELLTNPNPDITFLRDSFNWHIFPVVNPDGYHYTFTNDRLWRKTRSKNGICYGTDANRNWDHNWGQYGSSSNPCNYQTYAGSKPFSEIETKNIADYVSNIENLTGYLGFHADAQMLLVPYSDSTEHHDNYDDLIQIGNVSLEYGKAVNGEEYTGPATAAEILYKASGGSMDWVREALGTPLVYTYELRGDYFQWPKEKIPEQGDEVTQMILGLMLEAKELGYF